MIVVIVSKEGLIDHVVGAEDYGFVYLDDPEYGECPICKEKTLVEIVSDSEWKRDHCPKCGVTWHDLDMDGLTDEEARMVADKFEEIHGG